MQNSVQPTKQKGSLRSRGHGYSINDKSATIAAADGKIALPGDADLEGVRAFTATAGEVSYLVGKDGSLTDSEGNAPADATEVTLLYHAQTTAESRGDFEDNLGDSAYTSSAVCI